jgi:hypothetical protein
MRDLFLMILRIDWFLILFSLPISFFYFIRVRAGGGLVKGPPEVHKGDVQKNADISTLKRRLRFWLIVLFMEGGVASALIFVMPTG